ncbi:HAD family hydrolase [uncultured Ruminococcus sp.]|uniref:HAD family hydrolase n=1 Tax=uncultured Ruminococcus sp. TaxID=165186 RepID=UPI002614A1CF|nr:HAD family hydrolase [uncultured Ruminococcus sp.]
MKEGLIFDMDGTLWDSSENVALSWTEKIRELGLDRADITKQDVMSVMGLTMDRIADILFADYPKKKRMEILDLCCQHENDYLRRHGGVLYPDLERTLICLGKKYHLYIVSNCQSGYIEAFLEHYGFERYFDDIECYGNNLKGKGDNIALVVERNGLDRAWYVGDIQGDCDAAEQAGISFIHAAYGFGSIDHAVPELKWLSDLPNLMENITDKK